MNKNRLKLMREAQGLTQKDLADKSGVNIRMIQHYEQGSKDINKATAITVAKLAIALDCNVLEILNI